MKNVKKPQIRSPPMEREDVSFAGRTKQSNNNNIVNDNNRSNSKKQGGMLGSYKNTANELRKNFSTGI
jgi:hypothetical protein